MDKYFNDQLKHKAEQLNKLISEIDNDFTNELSFKIKDAVEKLQKEQASKPLIITLLGGSGVGKSYIFSALHGKENLSMSSDGERAFTKKLIISCEKSQQSWAPMVKSKDLYFTDESYSRKGLMVIDTPDIDSDDNNNEELAKEAVKVSDIIVYVADPDKMKDFKISEFLKSWFQKKLWYFVVNKVENYDPYENKATCKEVFINLLTPIFLGKNDDISKYVFCFSARKKDEDKEFLRFKNQLFKDKTTEGIEAVHDNIKLNAFLRLTDSDNGTTINSKIEELVNELIDKRDKLEEIYINRFKDFIKDKHVSEEIKSSFIHHFFNVLCGKMTLAMAPFFAIIKIFYKNKSEDDLNQHLNEKLLKDYQIQKCYSDEKDVLKDKGFNIDLLQNSEKALVNISQNKVDIAEFAINEANYNWDFKLFKLNKWDFKLFLANLAPVLFFAVMLYHSVVDWLTGNWLPTNFFVHGFVLIILSSIIGFSIIWSEISKINVETLITQIRSNKDEDKQTHFLLTETAIARLNEVKSKLEDLCNKANERLEKTKIPDHYGFEVYR